MFYFILHLSLSVLLLSHYKTWHHYLMHQVGMKVAVEPIEPLVNTISYRVKTSQFDFMHQDNWVRVRHKKVNVRLS